MGEKEPNEHPEADADLEQRAVVTVFLRNGSDVLLLRRSETVGSYAGQWGAVAGHAEGAPDTLAYEEIIEETGLGDAASRVRRGEPFDVSDPEAGVNWTVHPYLYDCESRDVTPNEETTEWEWVSPIEILERDVVPDLWTSYARIAPTVESIREDREHGSAYLSYRALEVLRDHAAANAAGRSAKPGPANGEDLGSLAAALREARTSMAVLENRVNRAMARAGGGEAQAVRDAAEATLREAIEADSRAAREAAALVREAGGRVLTISTSGTVLEALRDGADEVVVCESRPSREGVNVAETLAGTCDVTLVVDAAAAHVLTGDVDAVLVGADAVLPDGRVVNKVGTRGLAIAAAHEDIVVFAVSSNDKIRPAGMTDQPSLEQGSVSEVYDGECDIRVENPTFDVTPATHVTIVTENGRRDAEDVAAVAREHRTLRDEVD